MGLILNFVVTAIIAFGIAGILTYKNNKSLKTRIKNKIMLIIINCIIFIFLSFMVLGILDILVVSIIRKSWR